MAKKPTEKKPGKACTHCGESGHVTTKCPKPSRREEHHHEPPHDLHERLVQIERHITNLLHDVEKLKAMAKKVDEVLAEIKASADALKARVDAGAATKGDATPDQEAKGAEIVGQLDGTAV